MTIEKLRSKTKQDLARIAKKKQVAGWHSMTKDQLAKALARLSLRAGSRSRQPASAKSATGRRIGKKLRAKTASAAVARTTKAPSEKSGVSAEPDSMAKSVRQPLPMVPDLAAARNAAVKQQLSLAQVLRSKTKDELERIAKKVGVTRWHSLRKEELVRAINRFASRATDGTPPAPEPQADHHGNGQRAKLLAARKREQGRTAASAARRTNGARDESAEEKVENAKYYGAADDRSVSRQKPKALPRSYRKDRIVAMVRDPYWLHVYWELTSAALARTEAALAQDWYTAKPILRLLDVSTDDTTSSAERVIRDIEIHGGANNWYVELADPPGSYRVDIGYLTTKGRFFVLARSNSVTTPKPGLSDRIDEDWTDIREDCERIYAMSGGGDPATHSGELRKLFEDRLRRPMSSGSLSEYGSGALREDRHHGFSFKIDAELIVYGKTDPKARVTLQGEPVHLRSDGSFTMRFCLPDGRQILPAVAATNDGIEVRTVILAVERNTKELEPLINDGQD